MRPEIATKWNDAILIYEESIRHLIDREHQEAEKRTWEAIGLGIFAMLELFPDASDIERIGLGHDVFEAIDNRASPRDCVNGARRFLNQCINLSPPENKLWGEEKLGPLA